MSSEFFLMSLGILGFIASVGYFLVCRIDNYSDQVTERVQSTFQGTTRLQRIQRRAAKREEKSRDQVPTGIWQQLCARLVPNRESERERHQSRLVRAGIYRTAALTTFFSVKLVLMITPPLVGLIVAATTRRLDPRLVLALGCLGGIVGMLLPTAWLDRKIRRRQCELRRALPDWLDLMSVCLQGGLSLPGTLQRVTEELTSVHPVLSTELAITQREVELGFPVHAGIKRFGERTGCDAVLRLANLIRDAERLGTELYDALRLHADTLRDQREAEAEERAQKASVKILIPTLLCIFPAVFVVLAGPAAIKIHQCFSQRPVPPVKVRR